MGKLAFWLVATVIFFGLTTQRMMLSNESSALEVLTSESNKFMDLLHRNHGDAIIKADAPRDLSAASLRATMSSISTSKSTPATTATASATAKSKSTSKLAPPPPPPPAKVVKDTRSFAEMLGDYVDAKPESAGGTKVASTPLAAKPGSTSTAAAATKRGQKVKQPNLVEAEEETADKQAVRLGAQHPPPQIKLPLPDALGATTTTTLASTPLASTPKPKPKPKPKPQPSPLDSLPPPPDRSYHPLVSPRAGTDISPENQLSALRCRNQSACIVPALQLAAPLKIYFCRHPARHGVRFYYLVREGLHLHPNVHLVPFERIDEADFVVYLPGSSPWHLTECTNSSLKHRMLVLDEFDGCVTLMPIFYLLYFTHPLLRQTPFSHVTTSSIPPSLHPRIQLSYNLFHPFERIEQVQEAYGKVPYCPCQSALSCAFFPSRLPSVGLII